MSANEKKISKSIMVVLTQGQLGEQMWRCFKVFSAVQIPARGSLSSELKSYLVVDKLFHSRLIYNTVIFNSSFYELTRNEFWSSAKIP